MTNISKITNSLMLRTFIVTVAEIKEKDDKELGTKKKMFRNV